MAKSTSRNKKSSPFRSESLHTLIQRMRDGSFSEILDDWKWILQYSKQYKGAIALYLALGILSSCLGLLGSVASKYLIDIITGYQMSKLGLLILLTVSSSVITIAFNSITNRVSTRLSIRINNNIQADIFAKIMDADWLAISRFRSGDILNRFNNDVATVSGNAISWLPSLIISLFHLTATFCVIWHYDPVMALIAFASAPFMLLLSRFLMVRQRRYNQDMREMSSDLMTFEAECFYNMDTIKSLDCTPQYRRRMKGWQEKYQKVSLDYNRFSIKTNVALQSLGLLVQYAAFGYCLFRLWTHSITYGTMTLFLQQRSALSSAFNQLVAVIPSFLNSSVSAHRIRELVQLPKEVHLPASAALDGRLRDGFTIRLDQIDFSYQDGQDVVTKSDFEARPGEIVALVGPSGEGKTTMIRLLLGLIHPQGGRAQIIASDGTAVEMNADTRHLFAYVPQGNTILSGTIAENMRMVKESATDEEMIRALKAACAWEFVSQMPDQLNSKVGERGRGLSEGQAQRIAIARAILRDAPILLLDEATSALDIATERRVLRSIVQQCPERTCIVTTHRPSVLSLCRHVYRVMDHRVTELSSEESSRMAMDF